MELPPELTESDDRDPVVLVIAGNDPSGGAGACADIQAVTALGAYPAPVLTALTVQDTRDAYEVQAAEPELVSRQIQRYAVSTANARIGRSSRRNVSASIHLSPLRNNRSGFVLNQTPPSFVSFSQMGTTILPRVTR